MLCPTCVSERLVMSERSGIEIDYCQNCRGVWLDRGELEKLIERAVLAAPVSSSPVPNPPARPSEPLPVGYRKRDDDDDDDDWHKYGKYRKKKGFLGEIFDF